MHPSGLSLAGFVHKHRSRVFPCSHNSSSRCLDGRRSSLQGNQQIETGCSRCSTKCVQFCDSGAFQEPKDESSEKLKSQHMSSLSKNGAETRSWHPLRKRIAVQLQQLRHSDSWDSWDSWISWDSWDSWDKEKLQVELHKIQAGRSSPSHQRIKNPTDDAGSKGIPTKAAS